MRWGEVETYKFVNIYLSHEYLWNSDHENYKLKEKRQKAYKNIIKEFMSSTGIRLNESEVKIKIKNLRSTYIQEIAKIRTRSIRKLPYIPTIKWFSVWHKCFRHRSKKSLNDDLVYDEQNHGDELNNKMWITHIREGQNNKGNMNLFGNQVQNNHNDFTVKYDSDITSLDKIENPYLCKIKEKKSKLLIPYVQRRFKQSISSNLESILQEDEFDIYGKYIASQLRRMNLEKALKLQLEMASLVSNARIADLSDIN